MEVEETLVEIMVLDVPFLGTFFVSPMAILQLKYQSSLFLTHLVVYLLFSLLVSVERKYTISLR